MQKGLIWLSSGVADLSVEKEGEILTSLIFLFMSSRALKKGQLREALPTSLSRGTSLTTCPQYQCVFVNYIHVL